MNAIATPGPSCFFVLFFNTVSVRYCGTKPAQFSAGLIATGVQWPEGKDE